MLHNLYHGKGERSPEEVASLVGLRLPTQPGGKGWEKWGQGRGQRWKKIFKLFRNDLSVADTSTRFMSTPKGILFDWRLAGWRFAIMHSSEGTQLIPVVLIYQCSMGENVMSVLWVCLKQLWKNNQWRKKVLLSCKYTVLFSLSMPAFVCFFPKCSKAIATIQKDCEYIFILIHLSY